MKNAELKNLYQSLSLEEKNILQQLRNDFEHSENIKFVNLESYLYLLASNVIAKQRRGEFVPKNIEEAQAGYYL